MAKQTVGRTALGAAVCRLIEQYQNEKTRLFYDPVVKELVGTPLKVMMGSSAMRSFTIQQTDAVAEGIYGAQVCRTRYIDDVLQAGVSQGIRQLVILGAGLDTRPYRLPGLEDVNIFEVDLDAVQNDKKKKLQKYFGQLPKQITFIPIDFDIQTLESVFTESTFDASRPGVFIWEGVTQYITEEAVRRTLAFVGKSVPGSILVFTYVLKSIIEHRSDIPGAERMMDQVAAQAPWIFGLEPSTTSEFLKPYHLSVVEDVGNKTYQERYLKPMGRKLVVSEGERIVQAVVG